jgi:uncharacterized paraquat-inducible protein A
MAMRKQEVEDMDSKEGGIPKEKSVTLGVTLATLGLCGLALALVLNPILQENKGMLELKKALDEDTPEDHQTVAIQTVAVLGGFLAGGPFLLIGIVLIATAMIYNSKLDAVKLKSDFGQQERVETTTSSQPSFCAHCGQPTQGKPFCVYCGKKVSP